MRIIRLREPQEGRCWARVMLGCLALVMAVFAWGARAPSTRANGAAAQFALAPVYYDRDEPATQSYFIFDAAPSKVIQSQVRVINTGAVKGTAHLYAVDAATGQTSGTVYRSAQSPRQDVGAWVTLDTATVTLTPGQSQVVHFSLVIAEDVRSGQHVGGIVAESDIQQASDSKSAIQVNIQNLTVVGVLVNLRGARIDSMKVSSVTAGEQDGYQTLELGLSNTGTSLLKPKGELDIDDSQGKHLYHLPLTLDTFLPVPSITYPVYLSGPSLVSGSYRVRLVLEYGTPLQTLVYTTKLMVTEQQVTQVFGSHKTTDPGTDPLVGLLDSNGRLIGGGLLAIGATAALVFALGLFLGRRKALRQSGLRSVSAWRYWVMSVAVVLTQVGTKIGVKVL